MRFGITAEEQRDDGVLPGEIDELLVGQQRVGVGRRTTTRKQRKTTKMQTPACNVHMCVKSPSPWDGG